MTADGLVVRAVSLALITLLTMTRCGDAPESGSPQADAKTDSSPVTGASPYWCELVSREDLRLVTGVVSALEEQRSGWLEEKGGCLVRDSGPAGPLGLRWSRSGGREVVDRQRKKYVEYGPERLPRELGNGFLVHAPSHADDRPYYVVSTFRCGRHDPWLRIDVGEIQEERSYREDLVALMRIAEERFGVLHGCEPGPLR